MSDTHWNKYLTKGLPYSGNLPQRQNLLDLSKEQIYLYVEGLKRFQDPDIVPISDPLSFYEIAAIHGLPYETWPKGNKDIPGRVLSKRDFGGFCTHSSILFLTWHRPYLALFEKTLQSHVQAIADGIDDNDPQKQEYLTLADNFRTPYWDWARLDVQIVPQLCLDSKYRPVGPTSSGSSKRDYNPLHHYVFPEKTDCKVTMIGKDGKPYSTTVRYPDPQSENDNILYKMQDFYKRPSKNLPLPEPLLIPERNLTERTAYILQSYQTYGAMSNNDYRASSGTRVEKAENWGSLEDIHNAVHDLTGGVGKPDPHRKVEPYGGHMASVPNSAFDPIFWLHHVNIDRLFDIWQALHEDDSDADTFVTTQTTGSFGNFATPPGGKESKDTPLYPFRPTVDSWYDSDSVKKTEDFGYTYPETNGLSYPTNPAQKKKLYDIISSIYESPPKLIRQSKQHIDTAGQNLLARAQLLRDLKDKKLTATVQHQDSLIAQLADQETLLQRSLGQSKPYLRNLAPQNKYLEWLINVKVAKHVLDGAYTVHFFLGAPDEQNVALWPASPTHVGTFATLGQKTTTGCAKCQVDQANKTEVTGQVPLTLALMERYLAVIVDNLTPAIVVPYLTEHLHWRVAKNDGTVVEDRRQVTGLTVFVISNEVTLPEDESELPIYAHDVKIHPEITTNASRSGRGGGTGLTAAGVPA